MNILNKDILRPEDKKFRIINKSLYLSSLIVEAHGLSCCISMEDLTEKENKFTCNKCGRMYQLTTQNKLNSLHVGGNYVG